MWLDDLLGLMTRIRRYRYHLIGVFAAALIVAGIAYPRPADDRAPSSVSFGKMHYTIYHTSSTDETIDVIKKHFTDPAAGNYLYEDTRAKAMFQSFDGKYKFIIAGTSYKEVTGIKFAIAKQYNFGPDDVIVYDIEDWPATPSEESADVVGSIDAVMKAIRDQGYKAGVTPDYNMIVQNYKQIDWQNVDLLGMQIQRFTGDTERLVKWANEISEYVKSVNPNTEVFAQVTFRQASNCYSWNERPAVDPNCNVDVEQSLGRLEHSISEVAKIKTVDGFIVSYLPTDVTSIPRTPCPPELCNPRNLDRILSHIEDIE